MVLKIREISNWILFFATFHLWSRSHIHDGKTSFFIKEKQKPFYLDSKELFYLNQSNFKKQIDRIRLKQLLFTLTKIVKWINKIQSRWLLMNSNYKSNIVESNKTIAKILKTIKLG